MQSFKGYIREITVSPDYRQGNVFNPFYDMSKTLVSGITKQLTTLAKTDKKLSGMKQPWKFKSISSKEAPKSPKQYLSYNRRSGYYFRILDVDDIETEYYIRVAKSETTGHFGMKSRKSATASSDINELMTLYFLKNNTEKAGTEAEAKAWIRHKLQKENGDTGIVKAESTSISYTELRGLIDKDSTAIRDVQIGWNNAKAVKTDLGGRSVSTYHWVPVTKVGGIIKKNPSDIILKLSDNTYIGYSNKISAGKDTTPKFNTNINAFYKQLGDSNQLSSIQSIMDDSWEYAAGLVSATKINATRALNQNREAIKNADYTESNLKAEFGDLGRDFNSDELNFFGADFYYPYRNNLITLFAKHLENADNLSYFLQTVSGYTFSTGGTPCPYKLLVGSVRGSTITDVSSDDALKSILETPSKDLANIVTTYDGTKQSFKLDFKVHDKNVNIPITVRTRATGGWSGKSLYIETSGVKVS